MCFSLAHTNTHTHTHRSHWPCAALSVGAVAWGWGHSTPILSVSHSFPFSGNTHGHPWRIRVPEIAPMSLMLLMGRGYGRRTGWSPGSTPGGLPHLSEAAAVSQTSCGLKASRPFMEAPGPRGRPASQPHPAQWGWCYTLPTDLLGLLIGRDGEWRVWTALWLSLSQYPLSESSRGWLAVPSEREASWVEWRAGFTGAVRFPC